MNAFDLGALLGAVQWVVAWYGLDCIAWICRKVCK
jgi:hypothetical protein